MVRDRHAESSNRYPWYHTGLERETSRILFCRPQADVCLDRTSLTWNRNLPPQRRHGTYDVLIHPPVGDYSSDRRSTSQLCTACRPPRRRGSPSDGTSSSTSRSSSTPTGVWNRPRTCRSAWRRSTACSSTQTAGGGSKNGARASNSSPCRRGIGTARDPDEGHGSWLGRQRRSRQRLRG